MRSVLFLLLLAVSFTQTSFAEEGCNKMISVADDLISPFVELHPGPADLALLETYEEIESQRLAFAALRSDGSRPRIGDSLNLSILRQSFRNQRERSKFSLRPKFREDIIKWLTLNKVQFDRDNDIVIFKTTGETAINQYAKFINDRFGADAVLDLITLENSSGFVAWTDNGKLKQGLSLNFVMQMKAQITEEHELIHLLFKEMLKNGHETIFSTRFEAADATKVPIRSGHYDKQVSAEELVTMISSINGLINSLEPRSLLRAKLTSNRVARIARRIEVSTQKLLDSLEAGDLDVSMETFLMGDSVRLSTAFIGENDTISLYLGSQQSEPILKQVMEAEQQQFNELVNVVKQSKGDPIADDILNQLKSCQFNRTLCMKQEMRLAFSRNAFGASINFGSQKGGYNLGLAQITQGLSEKMKSLSQLNKQLLQDNLSEFKGKLIKLRDVASIARTMYSEICTFLRRGDNAAAQNKLDELKRFIEKNI